MTSFFGLLRVAGDTHLEAQGRLAAHVPDPLQSELARGRCALTHSSVGAWLAAAVLQGI